MGLQESEEDLLFWIMRARQSAPARQGEGIEGRLGLVGRWIGQIPRKKVGRWRRRDSEDGTAPLDFRVALFI